MNTPSVTNHGGVEQLFQALTGDAAIDQGAPVALDVAKIAAATSTKGLTIGDYNAVAAFIAELTTANQAYFVGVAEKAFAAGDKKRVVSWGPTRARVYNPSAASLTLAVGDLLYGVPGSDYFIPALHNTANGTAVYVANCHMMPRAFVRKAVTMLTVTTALVEVYVYPPQAPKVHRHSLFGLAGATMTGTLVVDHTMGYGKVLRAGMGCNTGGNAGSIALALTVGGRTILTTQPVIANDCDDPVHHFCDTDAEGRDVAELGTGGTYGVISATTSDLYCNPNEKIEATVTNSSSFIGTLCRIDVDILYY